MTTLLLTLHLVVAAPAAPTDFHYQTPPWSAFYGCWQAEGAPASELVCLSPANGGVRLATVVDGTVRDESRIIADGIARSVRQAGCSGTERARWSSDGQRVFLDSNVSCSSSGRRTVRGLFAFIAPDEWVSVQTAAQGDSMATRVVRFRAADRVPAGLTGFAAARMVSDYLFSVDQSDVAEAVDNIGAEAAQEWMRAAGEPYQLTYQPQDAATSSALEQVGRMSNPVEVREVVHVVERPVYVYNPYVVDRYWHYSPWGYHYHGWHWLHRPVIVVRWPIVIYRNSHYHRDWYRNRYDWRRDRDWRDGRYVRNDDRYRDGNRDRDRDRGRVTRDGYSSGRDRAVPAATTPDRARSESPRSSSGTVVRQATTRTPRASGSTPERSGTTSRASSSRGTTSRGTPSRGTTSRTARPRSGSD